MERDKTTQTDHHIVVPVPKRPIVSIERDIMDIPITLNRLTVILDVAEKMTIDETLHKFGED